MKQDHDDDDDDHDDDDDDDDDCCLNGKAFFCDVKVMMRTLEVCCQPTSSF